MTTNTSEVTKDKMYVKIVDVNKLKSLLSFSLRV